MTLLDADPLPTAERRPRASTRRMSVANLGVKLGATGLAFAVNLVLARNMSPESFAEVSVALAWLALATALGCLSTPLVLMRFVGESLADGRPDLARGVIRASMLVAGLSSLAIVVVALLVLAFDGSGAVGTAMPVAMLCVALIIPNAMLSAVTGLLQALKQPLAAELLGSVLRSFLLLAVLSALWGASGHTLFSSRAVLAIYLVVAVVLLLLASVTARRVRRQAIGSVAPAYAFRRWAVAGTALLAVLLAAAANERVDLLMLSWQAPGSEVATYAVAQRFAQIMLFAANAVGAVMAPHFVLSLAALRAGDREPSLALVRSSARLMLLVYASAWAFFVVAGPWLPGLFGPHYESAYLPLLILIGGQAVAAMWGPGTLVATLSGHTRFAFLNLLLAIAVNAALNLYSVPRFGAVGAAASTAVAGVVAAFVAQVWLRRILGIRIDALPARLPGRTLAGWA